MKSGGMGQLTKAEARSAAEDIVGAMMKEFETTPGRKLHFEALNAAMAKFERAGNTDAEATRAALKAARSVFEKAGFDQKGFHKVTDHAGTIGKYQRFVPSAEDFLAGKKVTSDDPVVRRAKQLMRAPIDVAGPKLARLIGKAFEAGEAARQKMVKLFEVLAENRSPLLSHPKFRNELSRDENLFVNQLVREANGNIAYKTVDFDIAEMTGEDGKIDDDRVWARFERSPYWKDIEENAAIALVKMGEKLEVIS